MDTGLLPLTALRNVFVHVLPMRRAYQMEKLRQAHAKEKKEALAEFRAFKRSAKAREESIQAMRMTLCEYACSRLL